jgi:hypothetical protein
MGVSVQPDQTLLSGSSCRHKAKGHFWSPRVVLWQQRVDLDGNKKVDKEEQKTI